MNADLHPILSCEEAKQFEEDLFGRDEDRAWDAMVCAGAGVAGAIEDDFAELGGLPAKGRLLVLVGKGHNGGDALLAAAELAQRRPGLRIEVWFVPGERALRPLARRALETFAQGLGGRERRVDASTVAASYDLVIDGVFGFQYRPPLDARSVAALAVVNALDVRLRASVDLPSGWDDPGAFRADFTYATGSVKAPLLGLTNAGRLRLVDLGFPTAAAFPQSRAWVAGPGVLAPLGRLRAAASDKRSFGHLFVLGGSGRYPGAVLMSVLAALQSGVGLVTAFVPASLAPAFAARAPETMWVGWPETPEGGLAMEGMHLWRERAARASALLVGPGAGAEAETLALLQDIVRSSGVPVVIDADALQPELVRDLPVASVLTPHAGEFARIAGGRDLRAFSAGRNGVTVLKGPLTRIDDGREVVHSFAGGPVLARGGSGDLLAGLIGGLLAQTPADPKGTAIRGVVWHGRAADRLARTRGAVAVRTTELLDHFAPVINRLQ
jgi:ADP-dependent NAD(P)H-hydrate dehydratase / NAD(P)H-hydrate epimerase